MRFLMCALLLLSTACMPGNHGVELQTIQAPASDDSYTLDEALKPQATLLSNRVAAGFAGDKGPEQTADAIENILKLATLKLREAGRSDVADRLQGEWTGTQRALLISKTRIGDLGEHDPLSLWLAAAYDAIEAVLGQAMCDYMHISDIKIFNYGIPVVFKPQSSNKWCKEELLLFPTDTCEAEYARHFAGTRWVPGAGHDVYAGPWLHHGLEPVTSYWIAWGACEAATWGGGWFIICTPIGTAVEFVSERFIATKFSNAIYERVNK